MQWFPRICCVHSFALLNFLLAASTRFMHPMNPGSAEGYWDAMYGIYGKEWIAGVYAPRDGVCVYYLQGFHGQSIHVVPESEAARLLPEVRTRALRDCPYLSDEERALLKRGPGIGELTRARIDADDRKYAVDPQMLADSRAEHAAFDER